MSFAMALGQSFQKSLLECGTCSGSCISPAFEAATGQCRPIVDWATAAAIFPAKNVRRVTIGTLRFLDDTEAKEQASVSSFLKQFNSSCCRDSPEVKDSCHFRLNCYLPSLITSSLMSQVR